MKNTSRVLALLLAIFMAFSVFALTSCDGGTTNETQLPSADTQTQGEERETETNKKEENNTVGKTEFDFEGVSWINAVDFGFVGDGETPNDRLMREYIKYYGNTPIYFESGVYAFERTIAFDDRIFMYLDPKAELKCIAEEPIDYFITLRAGVSTWGSSMHDYALQSFIHGGVINANYKAKTALGLHGGHHTKFESFEICNVLETGIQTAMNEFKDGCFFFDNILIYNDKGIEGTVGIEDYSYDSMFYEIVVLNFQTGIRGGGTYFKDVSCWFNNHAKSLITKSVYAEITGGNPIFDHPMVDTYRTGFKLSGNACISITNMTWLTNTNMYSEDMQKENPMTIFHVESDKASIMLNGLYLPAQETLSFSNRQLPTSTFMGVRYPADWDPASVMKNFRNDTALLAELATSVTATKTGNLTAGADFNALYDNGIYSCELRVESGGKGVPPVKEVGVLTVEAVGSLVKQTFAGTETTLVRVFNGIRWSDWRS